MTCYDNDYTGILLGTSVLYLDEGGEMESYNVSLMGKPNSNVKISIVQDGNNFLSFFPNQVYFTPSNWSSIAQISVLAIDDSIKKQYMYEFIRNSFRRN